MVEDEGTPGHYSARISLRAPRAAIRVETTVNWQSMVGLAMSMAAGLWGGYGFIYIPHSSGKIDPALARILSAYDPDYLVDVLLTHGEVEAVGCSSARRSVLPASARTRKPTRQFKKLLRVSDLLGTDEIVLATTAAGPWKESETARLLKATAGHAWRFGKAPQVRVMTNLRDHPQSNFPYPAKGVRPSRSLHQ